MKDLRTLRFAVLASAVALMVGGCANPVNPMEDFGLTAVSESDDATTDDVQTESTWVIRDQDAFQRLWDRLFAGRTDRPMPTIDFTTQMIVVVSMGPQPTTGYSVKITGVTRNDRGIVVQVTTVSPGPNCSVGQMRTHPVAISRLRKTDRPVLFDFTRRTRDCSGR